MSEYVSPREFEILVDASSSFRDDLEELDQDNPLLECRISGSFNNFNYSDAFAERYSDDFVASSIEPGVADAAHEITIEEEQEEEGEG